MGEREAFQTVHLEVPRVGAVIEYELDDRPSEPHAPTALHALPPAAGGPRVFTLLP